MTQRTFTDEVLDDRTAAILRAKTPAERLAIASGLWEFVAATVRDMARAQHSDWSATELARHVASRMSHGAF